MYPYSPVSEIRGISKKRASVLAKLGIYSVEQFLDWTSDKEALEDKALKLGLSVQQLEQIRHSTLKEIGLAGKHPQKKYWIFLGITLIFIGIIFISIGTFVYMYRFTAFTNNWFEIHIYTNTPKNNEESFNPWEAKIYTQLLRTGYLGTTIEIKHDYSVYENISSPSLPQGFLIINQGERYVFENSEANFIHTLKRSVSVDQYWMTTEVVKETPISIPMTVNEKDDIDNIVGQIFLADLTKSPNDLLPIDLSNEYSLHIVMRFISTDPLMRLSQLTGGQLKVDTQVNFSEYEFKKIGEAKMGNIEMPENHLFEKKREEQNITTKFYWESLLQGQFITPDNMIASKRFYKEAEGEQIIKEDFVYEITGANWISYIVAIVGLPMCLLGWSLIGRYFRKR